MKFLSGFRVIDLSDEKGFFCSKILGDLGAEVIRVEKPGLKRDFWWWAYNSEKKTIVIDLESDREAVLSLLKDAHFLVESYQPGYLDGIGLGYRCVKDLNPGLVYTSITPFGQTGPYADYLASDLELMAISGVMYLLGDPDRPPVRIGFPQAFLVGSAEAAVGSLIAHCWRNLTGEGQHVDVSIQESLLSIIMHAPYFWKWENNIQKRTGAYRYGVNGAMFLHPMIWKCRDGHISFMLQGGAQGAHNNYSLIRRMCMEGDVPDFVTCIEWERYELVDKTREELVPIWDVFAHFFGRHTTQEIYKMALEDRIQLFPVNTVEDVLKDEQLRARGFWKEKEIGGLSKRVKYPGLYARITYSSSSDGRQKAKIHDRKCPQALPFEGIRVADFSWVAAAPWITQWLAEYGAEVIKVESRVRPDATRVSGPFWEGSRGLDRSAQFLVFNGGKEGITLNLNHPDGRSIALNLVSRSDVVVESFSPGMMSRWGLDYEALRKVNPEILMLSSSMMGATGPYASQPGLGLQLTSLAGFTYLTGWPDRDPIYIWGAYTDVLASRLGAAVVISALDYKMRSGEGCYIDLSQYEASLQFLSPLILEYQATGNLGKRVGNRSTEASPHGVFPCKGADRWCAISIWNDAEWRVFCRTAAHPEWAEEPKFITMEARKENEDDLEKLISQWTIHFDPEELMHMLQRAGLRCCAVRDCRDLYEDAQLKHRNHFVPVVHPVIGEYDYFKSGFRLEKLEPILKPAPCMGDRNEHVFKDLLELTGEEIAERTDSGAFR